MSVVGTRELTKSQQAKTLSLAAALVQKTGLTSNEARYFRELMETYQYCKSVALDKSPDENIFVIFLNSHISNTDNIIGFVGRLIERFFGTELVKNDVAAASDDE